MRYTINFQNNPQAAKVAAAVGVVTFNGAQLLPYEAAMLADALSECAQAAETKAAQAAATLKPGQDWEPEAPGAWIAADAALLNKGRSKLAEKYAAKYAAKGEAQVAA